jgi:hypothetical protein
MSHMLPGMQHGNPGSPQVFAGIIGSSGAFAPAAGAPAAGGGVEPAAGAAETPAPPVVPAAGGELAIPLMPASPLWPAPPVPP